MMLTQRRAWGPRPAATAQPPLGILAPGMPHRPQPGCPKMLSLDPSKLLLRAPGCHLTFLRLCLLCLLLDRLHRCDASACKGVWLGAEKLASSKIYGHADGCALPQDAVLACQGVVKLACLGAEELGDSHSARTADSSAGLLELPGHLYWQGSVFAVLCMAGAQLTCLQCSRVGYESRMLPGSQPHLPPAMPLHHGQSCET